MWFSLTDDQIQLRDAVRDALTDACPPSRVRAAATPDPALWALLADLGALGLELPEEHGGMGLSAVEACAVAAECGRVALPGPVVETLATAPLLPALGLADRIPDLLAGHLVISAALEGAYHPDADRAGLLLRVVGGDLVRLDTPSLEPIETTDPTRRLFRVGGIQRPLGPHGEALSDRAALLTAAFLVGLAERGVDLAVAYAKERHQFGKPIGSFQAVKHQLADAHVAIELARPCVARAAYALARREPDRALHVSMAKAYASDAATRAARAALQCHGAIGYSFEYDLHLWMKRAWALAPAWGDAAWHRARIATHVLDGDPHA